MIQMEPFIHALSKSTLVGSVIGLTIIGLLWLLGTKIPAAWRHGIFILVILRFALIWTPPAPWSWERALPTSVATVKTDKASPAPTKTAAKIAPSFNAEHRTINQSKNSSTGSPAPVLLETTFSKPQIGLAQWLLYIWLSGVALLGIYFTLAFAKLKRVIVASRPVGSTHRVAKILHTICAELSIARIPKITFSDHVESPALTGLFRPIILFPVGLEKNLSDLQIELVLKHELAHLCRKDLWINFVMLLLQAVHWFNPISWLVFWRTRVEAERACDQWVLRRSVESERKEYGHTLITILEHSKSGPILGAVGIYETKSDLKKRIAAIGGFHNKKQVWSMVATCIFAFALAAVGLTQAPKKQPTEKQSELIIKADFVVTDTKGNPTPNAILDFRAQVINSTDWETVFSRRTDAQGRFKDVITGHHALKVRAWNNEKQTSVGLGYLFAIIDNEQVPLPGVNLSGSLKKLMVHDLQTVDLKFIDENGTPISELKVSTEVVLLPDEGSIWHTDFSPKATTDRQGRCSLLIPQNSSFLIKHERPDLTTLSHTNRDRLPHRFPKDAQEITIRLEPAFSLSGTVSFPDGSPAAGVTMSNGQGNFFETDESGNYSVHQLPIGTHFFSGSHYSGKHVAPDLTLTIDGSQRQTVKDFALLKANELTLRFIDKTTKELIEEKTFNIPPNQRKFYWHHHHQINGYHHSENSIPLDFSKQNRLATTVELDAIKPEDTITGIVVDSEGKPVVEAAVHISPVTTNIPLLTNDKGEFYYTFDRHEKGWGHALVHAKWNDQVSDQLKWVWGDPSPTLKLKKVEGSTLVGRVTNEQGDPLPDADVKIWSTDQSDYQVTGKTDSEGKYRFENILPITLVVDVKKSGYGTNDYRGRFIAKKFEHLKPKDGEIVEIADIALPLADKSISGRVLDHNGKPVVAILRTGTGTHHLQPDVETISDLKGNFKLSGLIDDWLTLSVIVDNYHLGFNRIARVRSGSKDVEIRLFERPETRFYYNDLKDFTGKPAPPIVASSWMNIAGAPPSVSHGKKKRFITVIDSESSIERFSWRLRQIENKKKNHPDIEFLIVHRFWPKEEIEERLAEINKLTKITSPIAVEPPQDGITDVFHLGHSVLHAFINESGIVVHQTLDLKEALKFLDDL
ncbi:MAG: M56 family metallopeptidase [Verrucomicrobiota bacterium]